MHSLPQTKLGNGLMLWKSYLFEEWEAMIVSYQKIDKDKCEKILRVIAQHYLDNDVRFNAIRLLDEFSCLDQGFCEMLLQSERDRDVRRLLKELLDCY